MARGHRSARASIEHGTATVVARSTGTAVPHYACKTKLAAAARKGHLIVVQLLCEAADDKDRQDHWSTAPLSVAEMLGHPDMWASSCTNSQSGARELAAPLPQSTS